MKAQINLSSSEWPYLVDVELLRRDDIPLDVGFLFAQRSDNSIIKIHRSQIVKIYGPKDTPKPENKNPRSSSNVNAS